MKKAQSETVKRGYSRTQIQVPTVLKDKFEKLRDDISDTHNAQSKTVATAAVMLFLGLPRQAQLALIELAHKYDLYPERADPAQAWAVFSAALQIVGARRMMMREGGPRPGPLVQAPEPAAVAKMLKLEYAFDDTHLITMMVNALEKDVRGAA